MNSFTASFTAAFVATVVLSVVMVIQSFTGIAAEATFIGLITQFANEIMRAFGTSNVGWGIHFFVGVVIYGLIFGLFNYLVKNLTPLINGIIVALIFWLIMMIVFMPMLGNGLFGLTVGISLPLVTLIMHLIYGSVLGVAYSVLHKPEADALP